MSYKASVALVTESSEYMWSRILCAPFAFSPPPPSPPPPSPPPLLLLPPSLPCPFFDDGLVHCYTITNRA